MADNPLQVGHYRLLKTLGIGAFGKVKLGKHVVTGHLVAIKILNRNRIKQLDMGEKVRPFIRPWLGLGLGGNDWVGMGMD